MHTVASKFGWLRWFLIAALYVSAFGCATAPTPAPSAAAPAPVAKAAVAPAPEAKAPAAPVVPPAPAVSQQPVVSAIPAEPAPVVTAVLPAIPAQPATPHIALLLPLKSAAFGKAADTVQQGFLAAAGLETNGLPVRVYPCNDESTEVASLYQLALRAGAVAVAGPLTRNGVAALAASVPQVTVPTLALNLIDDTRTDKLYFYGLPPEAEAREAAQRATAAGLLSATIVSTDTPLSRRVAQAFADEWQRAGGILRPTIIYNGDPSELKDLPEDPGNSVFIAAEADKARLLRPYINSVLPVYATSQVFSGNNHTLTNYDLADVRFFDMPWMVQPDHPAVMIYPRPATPLPPELDRLYALGIDAYRLLQVMYKHAETKSLPLDGVTGKITLAGHTFQREAAPAIMRQGQGVAVDSKSRL